MKNLYILSWVALMLLVPFVVKEAAAAADASVTLEIEAELEEAVLTGTVVQNLDFGKIVTTGTIGTITINASTLLTSAVTGIMANDATIVGGLFQAGTPTSGVISFTSTATRSIQMTDPGDITLATSGGNGSTYTMIVSNILKNSTLNTAPDRVVATGFLPAFWWHIGGELTVKADNVPGVYTPGGTPNGTISIDFDYE